MTSLDQIKQTLDVSKQTPSAIAEIKLESIQAEQYWIAICENLMAKLRERDVLLTQLNQEGKVLAAENASLRNKLNPGNDE